MDTKLTPLPKLRQVFYDVYGSLPVANLNVGDLGYATDTLLLYRWNGAAWQTITTTLPSGFICMWHGTIATIPAGFIICDGNASTPNLLARFVQGVATAATNPGTTGGATNKTSAGHTHSLTVAENKNENTWEGKNIAKNGNYFQAISGASTATQNYLRDPTQSNTDTIADIRPLFYDIAFIMKT